MKAPRNHSYTLNVLIVHLIVKQSADEVLTLHAVWEQVGSEWKTFSTAFHIAKKEERTVTVFKTFSVDF